MKNSKLLYILFFSAIFFGSCEKMEDFSLSQSVFIEDPYCPGLPVYSEWGYNTFGIYIDRKPFISNDYDFPVKIIVNTDTLHILMRGNMDGRETDLRFSIKGYSPRDYFDLIALDSAIIDLKESGRKAVLKIGNETTTLNLIEGSIHFKRVQKLYLDEEASRTIMSGRFNLKTFLDDEPVAFSCGRFDFGIGYENFYNY